MALRFVIIYVSDLLYYYKLRKRKSSMKLAKDWKDYKVLATGDGEKLERWGDYTLLRPDPQVIWHARTPLANYSGLDGYYIRSSSGGGTWHFKNKVPETLLSSLWALSIPAYSQSRQ